MVLGYTPIFAAFMGMITTVLVGFTQEERMNMKKILAGLENGALTSLTAMMACIAAGIIVGVVAMTGIGQVITYNIVSLSGGYLLIALVFTALATLILSMASGTAVHNGPTELPLLVRMELSLVLCFFFSCLQILPSCCHCLYMAAGISGANHLK